LLERASAKPPRGCAAGRKLARGDFAITDRRIGKTRSKLDRDNRTRNFRKRRQDAPRIGPHSGPSICRVNCGSFGTEHGNYYGHHPNWATVFVFLTYSEFV